jgi:Dna[CI] antecedent, DciA
MTREKPEPIAAVLAQGQLGRVAAEAQRRRETTERVRQKLPPEEARELVAAHLEADGSLTIAMSSPAWAARVRYRAAELEVPRLNVRVAPRGTRA